MEGMLTLVILKACRINAKRGWKSLVLIPTLMYPSCKNSRELHDKRHREIASLVQAIQKIDETHESTRRPLTAKQKADNNNVNLKRSESAEASTDDAASESDWGERSALFDEEDAIGTMSSKEIALSKKAQRAERKTARNQTKFSIITPEDMTAVDRALHPEEPAMNGLGMDQRSNSDPLANQTIEANIAFNPGTFRFGTLRQAVHIKRRLKNNGPPKNEQVDDLVDEASQTAMIINRLGIGDVPTYNSRERKKLVTKLEECIKADLSCVANEDKDTMERMAGYWRYANRRTYNIMVNNNQLWDWSTGAKLEEIEEDEEDDDITSVDERFSEMSTAATTPIISHFPPDTDDYSDLELLLRRR